MILFIYKHIKVGLIMKNEKTNNKVKGERLNSYDTKYQSPSHAQRKSVKVFNHTHKLAEEIKFETREKANIYVYEKAIEYYANHLGIKIEKK